MAGTQTHRIERLGQGRQKEKRHLKTQRKGKHTWLTGFKKGTAIICFVKITLRAVWLMGWNGNRRHGSRLVQAFKNNDGVPNGDKDYWIDMRDI